MTTSDQLKTLFCKVEDPRVERTKKHPLMSILFVAICSAIAGIDDWVGMHDYCQANFNLFSKYVSFPHGVPSHDTFGRVLSQINPEQLHDAFVDFTLLLKQEVDEVIAIDGKTARGSGSIHDGRAALHAVSAWATENKLVLGQVFVDDKSNEITAIPKLLAMLDLEGQIVTIDAMGCQRSIASQIVEQGGDYVLGLKGNQAMLHTDIKLLFQGFEGDGWKDFTGQYYEDLEKGHGRVEYRRCWATSDLGMLRDQHDWPGLNSVAMVESERLVRGKKSVERRFYLSSCEADARKRADNIRSHWGVENCLHWVLDVTFNEDKSQIHKDNGPEIINLIRKWGLNILNKNRGKLSVRRFQNKMRMSAEYLLDVINQSI